VLLKILPALVDCQSTTIKVDNFVHVIYCNTLPHVLHGHSDKQISLLSIISGHLIGCLVAKLNNEYHLFLYSFVEADGDISGVAWEYMENLPNNIKNTIIN
jgi:hypothetical protein